MKKVCTALTTVFLFILVTPAFAVDVTGELVDLACYTKDKAKNVGAAHQECAVTCAKKGMTAAVVTDAGEVYEISGALADNNNARLARFMGQKVALQGSLGVNAGKKVILASSIKRAK
jgi:hypothetical protein